MSDWLFFIKFQTLLYQSLFILWIYLFSIKLSYMIQTHCNASGTFTMHWQNARSFHWFGKFKTNLIAKNLISCEWEKDNLREAFPEKSHKTADFFVPPLAHPPPPPPHLRTLMGVFFLKARTDDSRHLAKKRVCYHSWGNPSYSLEIHKFLC